MPTVYLVYDFVDQEFGPGESTGLVQAPLGICGPQGSPAPEYWLTIS